MHWQLRTDTACCDRACMDVVAFIRQIAVLSDGERSAPARPPHRPVPE